MNKREQLEQSIAVLEAQRAILGNMVADNAIASIKAQLSILQPPPASEQRKQITVLFSDLTGFTAMSEKMDAEEVRDIMNSYFAAVTPAIKAHGGLIEKFIGDAIMAVFGLPEAKEQDPENGVRAALIMQQALHSLNQQMASKWGFQLRMRIGVNTGSVVAGFMGGEREQDFTVVGDTVNTASRLEHAAPVGGILIGQNTYRHVRGIFDVTEQEPLNVKGKSKSLQTFLVHRIKPRVSRMGWRGVEGIETRMIGREGELQHLQDALLTALTQKETQMVTVVGTAGVGKSRLLHEFEKWVDLRPERFLYFKGQASPGTRNSILGLLRNLIMFRFQIMESDPWQVVWPKMETGIAAGVGESEDSVMQAHLIGQMVGLDFRQSPHISGIWEDGRQIRQRGITYLTRYFDSLSQNHPVLILLEDVHWADTGSLDIINHLATNLQDRHLLIVCLTRPSLLQRQPNWGQELPFHTQLDLQLLNKKAARQLVREILRKITNIPTVLGETIISRAEGNPLYIEELIKVLIDDGVIIRKTDAWQVDIHQLTQVRIPQTLTGILQARLDSLDNEEKAILQQASVIGRVFWDSLLTYMRTSQPPFTQGRGWESESLSILTQTSLEEGFRREDMLQFLQALSQQEMVSRQETTAFANTWEYLIKHALLRDVVYESVLKRERRGYHSLIADWLTGRSEAEVTAHVGLIADHLQAAERGGEAVTYRYQAGKQAYYAGERGKAKVTFEKALVLAEENGDKTAQALSSFWLGRTLSGLGEYEAAQTWLQKSTHLAEAAGDQRTLVAGWSKLGHIAEEQGRYEQARVYIEKAVILARQVGDDSETSSVVLNLAWVDIRIGAYEDARQRLNEALTLAQAANDQRQIAAIWNGMGTVAKLTGDYVQANEYRQQYLKQCQELGDQSGVAAALGNLGEIARKQGNYDVARKYAEESLAANQGVGHQLGAAVCLGNLGHITAAQEEDETAVNWYRQAIELSLNIGAQPVALDALAGWAAILVRSGKQMRALAWLGLVLSRSSRWDETKEFIDPALAELRAALPAKQVEAGLMQGQSLTLETILETQ